jgi:hypothetical protein
MGKNILSAEERATISNELNDEIDNLIKGCEALDMVLAFRAFDSSDDFLMMGTDGKLADINSYLQSNIDYLMSCEKFKLTTRSKEIRILGRDTAIFAWAYAAEALLKAGERDIIEGAGASFVFKRVNGQWKVIYYHESSSPPKRIKKTTANP